jgi:multiple sugar transport system ATP-binding protein
MAVVETRQLKKFYGDVLAVDNVDLLVKEGEFLVFLGPSGCGKTTTLRMIAGLEHPTSGEILIGDVNVTRLPPRARKVAMVFQSYALYPHMSAFDNIAFPLKAEKMDRDARKKKVERAAAMFGIEHLLKRKPRQLSGGERQRVALARALVREPNVFLLDEPLSNLDAKLRALARDELKQFQDDIGITTIYVTHDQVEAMGMGDRVIVMNKGKIQQIGTPQELYHKPANTFVATFLGSPPMNLIERDDVIVGFHPENFLPKALLHEVSTPVLFSFNITRVEYLGAERYLYGLVEGVKVVSVLPSLVTIPIEAGTDYEFVIDAKNLRHFDKVSGAAVESESIKV